MTSGVAGGFRTVPNPSFCSTAATWCSTVRVDRNGICAISAFVAHRPPIAVGEPVPGALPPRPGRLA
jgi:hypothetical protein